MGNQLDYGFRIYDPRIAKFLSVDPLTKDYPMLTPYQFASNRPIDGIDLDGLEFLKTASIYVGIPDKYHPSAAPLSICKDCIQPDYSVFLRMDKLNPNLRNYINQVSSSDVFVQSQPDMYEKPATGEQFYKKGLQEISNQTTPDNGGLRAGAVAAVQLILDQITQIGQVIHSKEINKGFEAVRKDLEYARKSVQLVEMASKINFPGLSNEFKADERCKAVLSNYILDGSLPVAGKSGWTQEGVDYLKTVGDKIYQNRDYIEKTYDNQNNNVEMIETEEK